MVAQNPWINIAEAARITGLTRRSIRRRVADGSLLAWCAGSRGVRFRRQDVEALFVPVAHHEVRVDFCEVAAGGLRAVSSVAAAFEAVCLVLHLVEVSAARLLTLTPIAWVVALIIAVGAALLAGLAPCRAGEADAGTLPPVP